MLFARNLHSNKAYVDKWLSKIDKNLIKGIFINHAHYDHVLDLNVSQQLTNAKVYGDKVLTKYLSNKESYVPMLNNSKPW